MNECYFCSGKSKKEFALTGNQFGLRYHLSCMQEAAKTLEVCRICGSKDVISFGRCGEHSANFDRYENILIPMKANEEESDDIISRVSRVLWSARNTAPTKIEMVYEDIILFEGINATKLEHVGALKLTKFKIREIGYGVTFVTKGDTAVKAIKSALEWNEWAMLIEVNDLTYEMKVRTFKGSNYETCTVIDKTEFIGLILPRLQAKVVSRYQKLIGHMCIEPEEYSFANSVVVGGEDILSQTQEGDPVNPGITKSNLF